MKIKIRNILYFGIAVIALGVAGYLYTFRPSATDVSGQKAFLELNAEELVTEFETNEKEANSKYLDKVMIVEGNIASITEEASSISVYLKPEDAISGVMCTFDKSSIDQSLYSRNQTVRVKGICTGYLLDVVLNKCVIVAE